MRTEGGIIDKGKVGPVFWCENTEPRPGQIGQHGKPCGMQACSSAMSCRDLQAPRAGQFADAHLQREIGGSKKGGAMWFRCRASASFHPRSSDATQGGM